VSSRGSPDPAFVCALAVFSKGQAFAFEARKWSQLGPSREALAWHLAPLASLWPAFGGQLGHKDGIKNQRKIDTKTRSENDRKIDPGASKIWFVFELEKQGPRPRFRDGRPRPSQGLPRVAPGRPRPPFGVFLVSLWVPFGPPWEHIVLSLALPWLPLASLGTPLATPWPPLASLRST